MATKATVTKAMATEVMVTEATVTKVTVTKAMVTKGRALQVGPANPLFHTTSPIRTIFAYTTVRIR